MEIGTPHPKQRLAYLTELSSRTSDGFSVSSGTKLVNLFARRVSTDGAHIASTAS